MNRLFKGILSLALVMTLTFGSTTAFADMRSDQMVFVGKMSKDFRDNINNIATLDTLSGGKWSYNIDKQFIDTKAESDDILKIAYAVIPFFNSMSIGGSGTGQVKISFNNQSAYKSSEVIAIAKKWNQEVIKPGMTDSQKIKAIHNKIAKEVSYDYSKTREAHSPGSAAIKKTAVCDGYTRMFILMSTLENIPAMQVTSSVMNHGFNLVYVDGAWKLVDVTWDDGAQISSKYLMIDPTKSDKHKFDTKETGMTLDEYIKLGNYVYADVIKSK